MPTAHAQRATEVSDVTLNTRTEAIKARENAGDQVVICVSFSSDWLREWCKFSEPITKQSKGKPMQSKITFDPQLKIALTVELSLV